MITAAVPIVLSGRLTGSALQGEAILVTGAGGGIGFEAARSLLYLGASVVIAEIDPNLCSRAQDSLLREFTADRLVVMTSDISDPAAVHEVVAAAVSSFGKVDIVLNNATYAPAGAAVAETPIEAWDRSYAVNLRGPALLAHECLPAMIERRHGAFVCVSSTGGPFLAPYETLKAAQLGLANSLDAELADTGVTAFTIGPGLVPTPTAIAAIERVAPRLGMTVDEFWRTNHGAVLSVQAAGAGFAAAVAEAHRYAGQEISSTQALIDAGIEVPETQTAVPLAPAPQTNVKAAANACARVLATLREQSEGWKQRSFFERQWMLRDFKQHCGVPVERCLETLTSLESELKEGSTAHAGAAVPLLEKLARYYAHMGELAAGYFKDASQRQEKIAVIDRWVSEVQDLRGSLID